MEQELELLSKTTLTVMFSAALTLAVITFIISVMNAVAVSKRLRTANPVRGTAEFVIASQIKRGVVAAVLVSIAVGIFTGQALLATRRGTFALANDTFSLAFITAVYVPLLVRATLSSLEFRDRKILEEV